MEFGPAEADDAGELLFLALDGLLESAQGLFEVAEEVEGGDTQGGGEDVVGGLVEVDVVEGVDDVVGSGGMSEEGEGLVGDDFVDAEVEGGSCAAGEGVDAEEGALGVFGEEGIDGAGDGLGLGGGEVSEFGVGEAGGFFDEEEGPPEGRVGLFGQAEGLLAAECGYAVEAVGGDGEGSEAVGLGAVHGMHVIEAFMWRQGGGVRFFGVFGLEV